MRISDEAALHGPEERRRNEEAASGSGRKFDCMVPVNDSLASCHRVDNMAERGHTVDHLVQDAAKRPNIASLADLHELWPARNAPAARAVRVQQRLGRHIVWRSNLGFAMDVHSLVRLDGVGNAKVNELETSLDEHKVGRFQVSVHNIVLVHALHTIHHLLPVMANKYRIQSSRFRVLVLSHDSLQVTFTHLHDLVVVSRLLDWQKYHIHTKLSICFSVFSSCAYRFTTRSTPVSFSSKSISPL